MASYPVLADGVCRVHLPYIQRKEYLTAGVDAETGWRYAYSWRATPLMRWVIEYSNMGDADMATIRDFFAARFGRYDEFSYTDDETGTTHTRCHFGMDTLEIRHIGANHHAVTVTIEEFGA